jgi:NADPH-dependent glutamate synthase beta subunit-like oxidoreductase
LCEMVEIKVNKKVIAVPEGSTILSAARKSGISIPTMCFHEKIEPFTSCMICVVKNKITGKLVPSCSTRVEDGMIIETDSDEVREARKTALALLLGEHVGDCEGPCRQACPAHMNIPLMLRYIEAGRIHDALVTIKEHIALPAVLGRICPAMCEKGCRRGQVDQPLEICKIKRFTADADLASGSPYLPSCKPDTGKKIAIVGAGPTGLSAAYYLRQKGHSCMIFDQHPQPGGMLRNMIPEKKLPPEVLDSEIEIIRQLGAEFRMNTVVGKDVSIEELKKEYQAIILAFGKIRPGQAEIFGIKILESGVQVNKKSFETSEPGIFAGGSAIRLIRLTVISVTHGRSLAISLSQYLDNQEVTGPRERFSSHIGKLKEDEVKEIHKDFPGVEKFGPEQIILEATRCLHCECRKSYSCKLRQYAEEYNASQRHYRSRNRKRIEKVLQHSIVIYEPGKCIKCGLCVRISQLNGDPPARTFIGRGFDVQTGVPLNGTLNNELEKNAAACVNVCPTGALVFKNEEKLKVISSRKKI